MPGKIVTKGLVLRETQTKEADKILTVLTAEHGKLAVVARGARRKNSKIAAASELLAFSELVLYEQRGWMMLDEASTLSLWDNVRRDVELLSLASYFAEMTEAVTGEEPAEESLSLLLNALYALDTLHKPPELVKAAFELKLLSLSGYEPLVADCAVCGKTAPEETRRRASWCANAARAWRFGGCCPSTPARWLRCAMSSVRRRSGCCLFL